VLDIRPGGAPRPVCICAPGPIFGVIDIDAADVDMQYNVDTSLYRSMFTGRSHARAIRSSPPLLRRRPFANRCLSTLVELAVPMATLPARVLKRAGRACSSGRRSSCRRLHRPARQSVPVFRPNDLIDP